MLSTPGITRAHQASDAATITLTYQPTDFTFSHASGYDTVSITSGGSTTEPGKPSLPACTLRVALPAGLQATRITILNTQEQTIPGTYTIQPTQPPQTINTQDPTFIPPDPTTYQSTTPYPQQTAILAAETDLDGQAIALITTYPIHYTPATNTLTLTTSLSITITGTPTHAYGDYLPSHLTSAQDQQRLTLVQDMVVNPDQVSLQTNPTPHTTGVSPGSYAYVIITKPDWAAAFQPLADWRTKTGIPATIVTTDWINNDGGYSGSTDQKINAFVQDAYTNWGTTTFLLGGDTDTVPCNTRSFPSVDYDPVPNDTYYADFDSDWTCEVNVGRASVTGTGSGNGGIDTFIAKQFKYEQNPEPGFATTASMFGFNLDGSTPTEIAKQYIRSTYIPSTWNTTNVYDSDSGNHRDNVIAAINAGQNLINHADHSGSDCMGTGYVNHGWLIYSSDMDALTNTNEQGILYSMGCDPAAYDVPACIGEHFVRNTNGGGIAFIGNSRYGWYYPGNEDGLSLKFDRLFFKAIFADDHTVLGDAVSAHKNAGITGDSYDQYIYTELTLLGDPATPIWTDTPGTLIISNPSTLPTGQSSYTVTVTSAGSPVQGATVCLMKTDEVYQVGTTDTSGKATLTVKPTTIGTMDVTVTKHNYLPSEHTATVIIGGGKLAITRATGGLMKINAVLTNPGNMTTSNIYWTITLKAPILLTGSRAHGTIPSLAVGTDATISYYPLIGFGPLTVTVTARADGIPTITKNATGYLLLILATAS